jgi:DsbC/DsbD-like thiol-disulfide interchange protein
MDRHAGILRPFAPVLIAIGCLVAAAGARASQAPLFRPNADPRVMSRLSVALTADTTAIVPGRKTVLRLDMAPAPGIHVYAPGNPDYIPVSVTLTAAAGVRLQPPIYPPGQDYTFGELKETVKVYSRAFEVRQQLVMSRAAARAAGASITIAGSVRYQACDDKVCFPPAIVPVSLSLPIAAVPASSLR